MYFHKIFIICIIQAIIGISNVSSDGFLGCGGFVKSDVDINYSLVEIKLYTAHGSIKYETDCAPNNGYYLIPVYDKGDFVVKVVPPAGWSFEPSSVELHIDGTTDKCSRGEDINFVFTGFSLQGQVLSSGQSIGPSDVSVTLHKSGQKEAVAAVRTGKHGKYSFSKLLPGEYEVKASHPAWVFDKDVTKVSIGRDNANIESGLVVKGYPVQGVVYSEKEPIKGVNFVLFSKNTLSGPIAGCDTAQLPGFSTNEKVSPICHVVSSQKGVFNFPVLPTGDYIIVPFYKGEHIVFDVTPERLEFSVKHASLTLPVDFEVSGFSVSGKVLDSANGQGIAGAKIILNRKEQSRTNNKGQYHLENMKTGHYSIDVLAKDIKFETSQIKITPNTPQLPDIIASRFRVCGKIDITKIPETLNQPMKRGVTFTSPGSTDITVDTDIDGSFCSFIKPGVYQVQVPVLDKESRAGLRIIPLEQTVKVTTKPLTGITFTQFKASVSGRVVCYEKCGYIEVSLERIGSKETKIVNKMTESEKVGHFTFKDLLPGTYKLVLLHDAWCWTNNKTLNIDIIDHDISGLEFTQIGYIFKCSLSHAITLHFTHEKKEGKVGSFELNKGTNRFCLAESGLYRLTPDSCHQFEHDVYNYDTSKPTTLTLNAVKHLTSGVVKADTHHADIFVTIQSKTTDDIMKLGPLEAISISSETKDKKSADGKTKETKHTGPFMYNFKYWAKTGDILDITATSHKLLFYPPTLTVQIDGENCPGQVASFDTKLGVFIEGSIQPPLEGVHIVISTVGADSETDILVESGGHANYSYSVGPLDPAQQYTVTANKPGYILEKIETTVGSFKVFKLAEINVQVQDEKTLTPLLNVLLSLSGGTNYRSNNLTSETGLMSFISLNPGQYYLRAMMKEYRFEPSSQMIDVSEGSTININIKGVRVAFSCHGIVTSLNGDAESGVIVEARGIDACSGHQEEGKTEQDGAFRIRGLQPECTYTIQVQPSATNQHLARMTPKQATVSPSQDIYDVRFIVFRRVNQLDVSGNIVTLPEYLSTLKVKLYRADNPDIAIHTVNLATTTFFYFPSLPIDNQKRSDDQEFSQSSILFLPFTVLIMVLLYHHDMIKTWAKPHLNEILRRINGQISQFKKRSSSPRGSGAGNWSDADFGDSSGGKRKVKTRKT